MKIAILGGGISGLTAAHHLRRDHEVVVFEARDRVGGNIRTEDLAGCRVEWAVNGFLDNEPATLELVAELGLEPRLVRARQEAAIRHIWRAGKLRQLPSSPPAFFKSDCLPLAGRLRVLLEPFIGHASDDDESVYDFVRRRLGRHVADILADAMVTGVFAGDVRRLSLASAFPKVRAMIVEHGSLLKAAKSGGGRSRAVLTSLDNGLEVLIEALTRGLDIRRGERLGALPSGFDRVLCTVPSPRAAEILGGDVGRLLRRIPTAPIVVVALVFAAPEPRGVGDAFGLLVPRHQGLRILGTLYDSSIFAGRAPADRRLFRTLLGGRHDPGVIDLSDDDILAIVAADLTRAWGHFPEPHAVAVIRHPLGIAQYEIGHAHLIKEIEARLPPEVRLAGSSYRGVALNACIREAREWVPELR